MRPLTQRFKTFNNKRNKSAIEVVVNSFLMDRKVVRMLPIAECVGVLDRKVLKRVAGKLSTPIILDNLGYIYSFH